MKYFATAYLLICSYILSAQIQQNINLSNGTSVDFTAEIDSLIFDPQSQEMIIIKSNSSQEIQLIDVVNVTFSGSVDPSQSSCGADSVLNPAAVAEYSFVVDQDQHIYKTIILGPYEVMAENLKTAHYKNGDPITHATEDTTWRDLRITEEGGWSHYENDSSIECPYGKLYNWYAVTDSRGLCPAGWHVPSNDEWSDFRTYFGVGEQIAGGPMKSAGYMYWDFPNTGAINERGFSALPAGRRTHQGSFASEGTNGFWWSIDEFNDIGSSFIRLNHNSMELVFDNTQKASGLSVRCMRD